MTWVSVVADMQARAEKNVGSSPARRLVGRESSRIRAMKRLAVVVPISLLLIFVPLFDAFGPFQGRR